MAKELDIRNKDIDLEIVHTRVHNSLTIIKSEKQQDKVMTKLLESHIEQMLIRFKTTNSPQKRYKEYGKRYYQ